MSEVGEGVWIFDFLCITLKGLASIVIDGRSEGGQIAIVGVPFQHQEHMQIIMPCSLYLRSPNLTSLILVRQLPRLPMRMRPDSRSLHTSHNNTQYSSACKLKDTSRLRKAASRVQDPWRMTS
jgi:hypothetical protein